jgi:hypothetical protein
MVSGRRWRLGGCFQLIYATLQIGDVVHHQVVLRMQSADLLAVGSKNCLQGGEAVGYFKKDGIR